MHNTITRNSLREQRSQSNFAGLYTFENSIFPILYKALISVSSMEVFRSLVCIPEKLHVIMRIVRLLSPIESDDEGRLVLSPHTSKGRRNAPSLNGSQKGYHTRRRPTNKGNDTISMVKDVLPGREYHSSHPPRSTPSCLTALEGDKWERSPIRCPPSPAFSSRSDSLATVVRSPRRGILASSRTLPEPTPFSTAVQSWNRPLLPTTVSDSIQEWTRETPTDWCDCWCPRSSSP